ncbi:methanogen marker protein 4 [Methanocaldococcus infernus ME]|uniref:Methanogen marker protein 4 n=1 Tax=Methanocaldococcus infernus (strain DSM 11812 / JCM 15783 / ME) TaxID=573063 RepID=D5VS20_METIM|nr:methanogenesis marker protein Mmp4/MtxX [Methanocaldococcus infernus]ADG13373.1 methanogen marker protein 4 [Methanocaldococcus infernus ME]
MIIIGYRGNEEVLKAYEKLKEEGIEVKIVKDPEELISYLFDKDVKGVIRGSLPSSEVIPLLRERLGKFYRASILKNPFTKNIFLLSPVGIDEVKGLEDKINIINYGAKFLEELKIEPKIALLSGGRLEDLGRDERVDRTIKEAEEVKKRVSYIVEHRGIVIEEYLKEDFNLIVAPDGISGNLIFRCLALVCKLEGYGAILLSEKKVNYIDTSRSGDWRRYYNAAKLLLGNFK